MHFRMSYDLDIFVEFAFIFELFYQHKLCGSRMGGDGLCR